MHADEESEAHVKGDECRYRRQRREVVCDAGVPKEVAAAVREMVSETAAKAVAEEENISVRKSSSSASGYFGVRKNQAVGSRYGPLGTFDSAEAAVARHARGRGGEAECKCIVFKGGECKGIGGKGERCM